MSTNLPITNYDQPINQNKNQTRNISKLKIKNKKFTILYANARGIKSKLKSLKKITTSTNCSLVILTETHLKNSEKINVKGYQLIGKNRPKIVT